MQTIKMNTTMKKNMIYKAALLLATAMLAGCAADNAAHENTGRTGGGTTRPLTDFASARTSDTPARRVPATPKTRTSMDNHQYLTGGDFMWEPGDNIYVKDDAGVLNKDASSNITAKQPTARFQVPGTYTASSTYEVRYTGTAASATSDNVTIAPSQTQSAPNATKHFGASGDCGTATATRVGDHFEFMLDHKGAYLCFLPRVMNAALAPNVYLTKIVVKSDNAIAGDYTLSLAGLGTTPTANAATEITLTTQGNGTVNGPWDAATSSYTQVSAPGFPLPTATSIAANAAYMVIAPGTHSLTVDYYIKDPVTNVEGFITKTLPVSKNYEANKVYDVTANLTPKDYSDRKFYMWDAHEDYWFGHESTQTTLTGQIDPNHSWPQNSTDPNYRWYNENGGSGRYDATTPLFASLPNANEMVWYCLKGDPRWDADRLWTFMGHLYKGGMWFKKKAKIASDNGTTTIAMANTAPDGVDLRVVHNNITNESLTQGLPSATEISNYFYLPALGYYYEGPLLSAGLGGHYWSSSANPTYGQYAYYLFFYHDYVKVNNYRRHAGFNTQTFE